MRAYVCACACACALVLLWVRACVRAYVRSFAQWARICLYVRVSVPKCERLRAVACGCVRLRAFASVRACTRGRCACVCTSVRV